MKTKSSNNLYIGILLALVVFSPIFALANSRDILSKEELLWVEKRNNTIVVYPERNYPPFSYQSPGGNIQGLSIDYLELISEKLGIKISYLNPQSKNQIYRDMLAGKGDVTTGSEIPTKEKDFIFTESYITVPTVIVVRKDYGNKDNVNLADFNGKRISVVAGSALYDYVRENYPRVVLEDVTDNEVSLQQIVLGEVDAGVMDVASLSYFLSKQVLSSVKIGGNTGYDYKLSFVLPKDKTELQSILEKGLSQITIKERELFNEKWIVVPDAKLKEITWTEKVDTYFGSFAVYLAFGVLIGLLLILIFKQGRVRNRFFRRAHSVQELKEDIKELEEANQMLSEELKEVQENEKELINKVKSIR